MEISINSVWKIKVLDGLREGLYRVLSLHSENNFLIIYRLNSENKISRPILFSLKEFKKHINKNIILSEFPLPFYMLIDDSELKKAHILKRDHNYSLIKELVSDPNFLINISTFKKSHKVAKHAVNMKCDAKSIYRYLSLFWKYGQDKNGLLPAYRNCGAPGKDRKFNKKQLNDSNHYIIDESDKLNFKKALKKYYLKAGHKCLNLKETYKNLLRDYYNLEIIRAEKEDDYPCIPSFRQFSYWKGKLISSETIIRKRTTENEFNRNNRSVLGSVNNDYPVPGSCFEIDATVADVHLVSEFRRNHVIGRPTIYSIVDRASRMIAGLHVSWEYASWSAARQALTNAFLPKSEYCKQFGININDSEWPCYHIPQRLICDNGEMIGLKAESLVVPLTQLDIAPPYRPDFKSIVEKRFDILNKEVLHRLQGTTKGKLYIRGSRNPKKDAIYTIKELTTLLIEAVLEHNQSIFDDLATSSKFLIENDLTPTPINFWNIHMENHLHALKVASEIEIIARMLEPVTVSMTRSGIHYKGMYYSCQRIEEENLASLARTNGRWKLDARIDQDTTNHIYVRLSNDESFTKCDLLERSKVQRNLPTSEILYFKNWISSKKAKNPISTNSISTHTNRKQIEKNAKDKKKLAAQQINISEQPMSIKERRSLEQKMLRENEPEYEKTFEKQKTETDRHNVVMPFLPRSSRNNE